MLDTKDLEFIVGQVLSQIDFAKINVAPAVATENLASSKGEYGVFERMEDAIDAAFLAQKKFVREYTVKDRERIIAGIRVATLEHAKEFARMIVDETKMGRYEDKITKNVEIIHGTPGTECLTTTAISSDEGLMLEEYAPFGVIGAITPVTNPTETIICNVIGMIAGGNTVVFNVHPSAKNVCAHCLQIINRTIVEHGGPADLATMVKAPTMSTVKVLTDSAKIRMMVGTGGMEMVNSLLRSGKKTIGAGAGNPPVVVDETADIKLAAQEIYFGASFDNNLLCLAEKEVFVVDTVANQLIEGLTANGAYLLNCTQRDQLLELVFYKDEKGYHVQKQWVGQNASKMLEALGLSQSDTKLLICETPADHPFVLIEQLMPVLPIVRCANIQVAMDGAINAERGDCHVLR